MSEAALRALLDEAVAAQVFPGGVLSVGDAGRPVLELAFGRRSRIPEAGPPVTLDTIYDLASLTKPLATSLVTLRLAETGRLALDDDAGRFVPGAPGTVRQLLSHSSGLPAWRPFHERSLAGRDAIIAAAASEPPERPPGQASVYSDLGFIVLGAVCERAGGARLDELAARLVFDPAGVAPRFVDLEKPWRPDPVAPTELGVSPGEVHDENCRAAGGVLGHAGLFGTASDLATLAAALVNHDGFPPDLLRTFFSPAGVPGSTWRLGWDGPAPAATQAGDRWPKSGVGHLGFTGTSIWLDLPRRRWVVFLTNRVHPSRDDQRIKQVRPAVHDAVVAMLDD
jgi:CubicO group peptidase (beta-lactamase class C family)